MWEAPWLDRLEAELDNLRAALDWLLDHDDAEMALRLVAELWWFWYKHGHLSEGRRWIEEALGRSASPNAVRAEALNGAGVLARNQADFERSQTWLKQSLALQRELGDERGTRQARRALLAVSVPALLFAASTVWSLWLVVGG